MATLQPYKGLQVLTTPVPGPGGAAINDDLKALVDWNPKSVWAESNPPTSANNASLGQDFQAGSLWLQTGVSPPKLFVCQSSTTSTAVWLQVMTEIKIVNDTAPQLGGNLDVNGKVINGASSNVVLQGGGVTRLTAKSSTSEVFLGPTTTMPNRGLPLVLESSAPGFAMFETGGPGDEKAWDFFADNGTLIFRCINDTITSPTKTWLQLDRDGINPALLSINVTTQITGLTKLVGPLYHQQTYCDNLIGTDSGSPANTVTFDLALSDMHYMTLVGNRTLVANNAHPGQRFNLTLKQDATGNKTVTWWNTISWPGGVAPTLSTGGNKSDIFEFLCTSTGIYIGRVWGLGY